jgi:L-ascorbate metabolism protein UlaG (beta-lactamase superfamily)
MRVEWHGQSAFSLSTGTTSVFIDPFGDMSPAAERGLQFEYPPINGVSADLLLVTHEHLDHNGVEAISGQPQVIRSTAGRFESPVGEVVAIASEHDRAAGTERGPNSIVGFELDELRIAHFGDFGQAALREEQLAATGSVDLLFVPVGGGPTIDAAEAFVIVEQLSPRWVVPMHYRTPRIGFLETADAFLGLFADVHRLEVPHFDTADLPVREKTVAVVPAAP